MSYRFAQVEVTTLCNFGCFYCAGRDMPQRHMADEVFARILRSFAPGSGITVSLQGEGEPTLHPRFWAWIEALHRRGLRPYTIVNGSRVDAGRFARLLPTAGVSIDTIDPPLADRIGRHNLRKVMANLEALVQAMGPDRVIVHTVDFGQPLTALRAYLIALGGVRHLVQPLQIKDDYARRYPALRARLQPGDPSPQSFSCAYLDRPRMRYFDVDGTEMPCCFIKDKGRFVSAARLRAELAQRRVPAACAGCRELR